MEETPTRRISEAELLHAIEHEQVRGLRRRLPWLMGGRIIAATLILGGTLLVAPTDGVGYEGFTPRFLLALIGATYAVSIAYSIAYPRVRSVRALAATQLAWDLVLVTGIVYASGGAASVFTFLYGAVILMAAIVVGPRATTATGVASVLTYTVLGITVASGWAGHPPDQPPERYLLGVEAVGFALLSNIVGLSIVALLATNLASRLRSAGGDLLRAAKSAADLARLNDRIVRSLSSGLITTDMEGTVVAINPAGARMFGQSEQTMAGTAIADLLPAAGTGGGTTVDGRGESSALGQDGRSFPVAFSADPLISDSGEREGTLITLEDLSEIQALRRAAARAESLAALGRIAAGLAHEIRNPLSSISGSVQMVRDSASLEEEDRHLLDVVLSETDRLNDLVTAMLQVGRPIPPTRETTDLTQLVRDVLEMAKRAPDASKKIRLSLEAPDGALDVSLDPHQIRQVVWNLVKNAMQASPEAGKIVVTVDREGEGHAFVDVRDEGPGFAEDAREKLFEMFYTSRPHGIGLGLALVKQIVTLHGGSVTVQRRDPGASFRVVLPVHAG